MYKRPIVKLTGRMHDVNAAISWITGYLDERQKKSADLRANVHGPLFQKPPGFIYVNDGLKKEVEKCQNPAKGGMMPALIQYLKTYHDRNKKKRRRIMGRCFVFSFDPTKARELLLSGEDPAALLVAAVQKTFDDYAGKYLPKDGLLYIMGIHHDALTHTQFKKNQGKEHLPNLHVHALLLNNTQQGHRFCLSNRYIEDNRRLDDLFNIYVENVRQMIYDRPTLIGKAVTDNPLPAFYAWLALDDYQKASEFNNSLEGIQFTLKQYQQYVMGNHNEYQQNFERLIRHMQKLKKMSDQELMQYKQKSKEILMQLGDVGHKRMNQVVDQLLNAGHAMKQIQLVREFQWRNMAFNLQIMAEHLEISLCNAQLENKTPNWIVQLHKASSDPSWWESETRKIRELINPAHVTQKDLTPEKPDKAMSSITINIPT